METLTATLRSLKQMKMKPNYSALSKEYGKDRHTIKKMFERLDEPPKEQRRRKSSLDAIKGDIAVTLAKNKVTVRSAYWYFKSEGKIGCTYSNFKSYVRTHGLRQGTQDATPHPLYETPPGDLVECDWVESIKLRTKAGVAIEFNVFSATLSYSRLHYFEFTETKTEAAFKRCFCHFLEWLGAKPRAMMTDNMSALVSILADGRKIHPTVTQFSKDIGVRFLFCRPRSPQTKGKDETANKYVKWLYSYDGEISTKQDIVALVKRLTSDSNKQANSMTGVPPELLFAKEKEHLDPLPSGRVIKEYEGWSHSLKVPQTQLVYYRGSRYSVPKDYITKTVDVEDDGETVSIFCDGFLIASHAMAERGVCYEESHLRGGLEARVEDKGRIDGFMKNTLSRFKEMGDERDV